MFSMGLFSERLCKGCQVPTLGDSEDTNKINSLPSHPSQGIRDKQ